MMKNYKHPQIFAFTIKNENHSLFLYMRLASDHNFCNYSCNYGIKTVIKTFSHPSTSSRQYGINRRQVVDLKLFGEKLSHLSQP